MKQTTFAVVRFVCLELPCIVLCIALPLIGYLGLHINGSSWLHEFLHRYEPWFYAAGVLLLVWEWYQRHLPKPVLVLLTALWVIGFSYMLYHHGWLNWLLPSWADYKPALPAFTTRINAM